MSRVVSCRHYAISLHSEVAYFAKEAGFHEALDQLAIDQRNSIRIMTGCATNANDLNFLGENDEVLEFLCAL